MSTVCSSDGGLTITGWKRRSRAPSFSMNLRYSSIVVAPMHWISPRLRAGLSMFEASIAPSAPPAPTMVCNSSMKMMMSGFSRISAMICLRRSSNWPRYLVPATTLARSRVMISLSRSRLGTLFCTMREAKPSTMAVLPTPGSPISTGLFFLRRLRIWITRSISRSRPMVGSRPPCLAISVMLRPNCSRTGLSFFSFFFACAEPRAPEEPSAFMTSRLTVSWSAPSRVRTSAAMPSPSRISASSRCSVPT